MSNSCRMITKDMTVAQAVRYCPCLNKVLCQMGFACTTCCGSEWDTLEQVAYVYGLDPELMIHTLNVARLFAGEPGTPPPPSK